MVEDVEMPAPTTLNNRYELREVLGKGGMGVVYKAYDLLLKREVALKTILDIRNRQVMDLFYREWGVLASIVHPNVVEIYDVGEISDDGGTRPYFVMPLLPGATLERLIRESAHRLTLETTVHLLVETCRGLHAAHERGLIHRDIKPSNIFVMADDSVKIIDFGVAHLTEGAATTGLKGTLAYMSPEQVQMKPLTAASDIFSVAVVAFEALTGRRPFTGSSDHELAEAIVQQNPPAAHEVNQSVTQAISQTIHKGMAKQPWHRYSSAREFGDTLQKALRREPIEFFDEAQVQPRLDRAARALENGDYGFASEVLSELDAEGYICQNIGLLRRRVDHAVRENTVRQLLENARNCFEQQEFSLALRKVQEALQLNPDHGGALALKAEVEAARREQKVGEWLQLARQHLNNQAFVHARAAVQRLLEIKPNDTQALQFGSEITRAEQDYQRQRQEKASLYNAALEAWNQGEVSIALTKLERLVALEERAPDTDPGRGASYRNFFNQVRTERDAEKNAYEAARTHLAAGNLTETLAICEQYLAKYPGHALFQALKFDVGERQRQALSAAIAETDSEVEAEPDLDRKLSILAEALRQFPGEPHFERASRLVRDKRDLVGSIAAKARMLEQRSQFGEAGDQWRILRTIHPQYPGLEFEIERLAKRRQQQLRDEARGQWVERIDALLAGGDYARAAEAVRQALTEFPEDEELRALEQLVTQGSGRAAEVMALVQEGARLSAEGRREEGLAVLRQAFQLDSRSAVARAVYIDRLIDGARALIDADLAEAERLVGEVLEADSGHAGARSLQTQIADRKRDEYVSWCTAQARRLMAVGDLDGARAIVIQGLASHPDDPRLGQLATAIQRSSAPPVTLAAPTVPAAPQAARQPPAEDSATPGESGPAAPATVAPPAPEPLPKPVAVAFTPESKAPSRPVAGVSEELRQTAGVLLSSWKVRACVLIAVAVLVLTYATVRMLPKRAAAPASGTVTIRVLPAGAIILIDGVERAKTTLSTTMREGTHRFEALLDGYQAVSAVLAVKKETPVNLNVALAPLPVVFRVLSNLESGRVELDGQPSGNVERGEIALGQIPAGKHSMAIVSPNAEARFAYELNPDSAPAIVGAIDTRETAATVISNFRGRVRVYSSLAPAKAALDNEPAGEVAPDGLELGSLAAGTHELQVGEGNRAHKLSFDVGPSPGLTAYLQSRRSAGSLAVTVNEDGATLYVNGQPYDRQVQAGGLRIVGLRPGAYLVRIAKNGFQELPEQKVEIRNGEETKAAFVLHPVVTVGTLLIRGAMPGAQVLLDGSPLGVVQPDGSLQASVQPGERLIELRRAGFQTRQHRRKFAAGQNVELGASEAGLEKALATVMLKTSPPDAKVNYRLKSEPESQARNAGGTVLSLPDGSYVFSAAASGFSPASATVELGAGASTTVELRLKASEPVKPAPAAAGMDQWEDPTGWTRENDWYVRQGGDAVLYRFTPLAGQFEFTVILRKGRRLRWVVNHTGSKNYALFEADKKNFYRRQVVNGKDSELARVAHAIAEGSPLNLRIEIFGETIVHSVRTGSHWTTLDTWTDRSRNFTAGRFGFLIPGKDVVAISNFRYQPR